MAEDSESLGTCKYLGICSKYSKNNLELLFVVDQKDSNRPLMR